jgi:hypothetical protein
VRIEAFSRASILAASGALALGASTLAGRAAPRPLVTHPGLAAVSDGARRRAAAGRLVYRNERYGFTISLPASWTGYSVIDSAWVGHINAEDQTPQTAGLDHGPEVVVRHPRWTAADPRQDIPILIFTHAQWELVTAEKLFITAAPVGPSELGRNAAYVFALPPRYNFSYLTGWEDVQRILEHGALHTF